MTIDKHTLDLARQWAEGVIVDDAKETHAAAEVIASLPDTIVDGDRLREVIDELHPELKGGDIERALRRLLPTPPAPLVEIKMGVWAMDPEHGKVMIVSAKPDVDGDVRIAWEIDAAYDGVGVAWVNPADLSPLPEDKPAPEDAFTKTDDDHAPEGGPAEDVPEFDSAYLYRDEYGDTWGTNPDTQEWICLNKIEGGWIDPPAEYGPYTRITQEKNE